MVAYPNQDKIVYGIVVGGNDTDPDPTLSGGCRVYLPTQYGRNVDVKHLPFSRSLAQGNQTGIISFNPPPEHGSAVMCLKLAGHAGTPHLHILGTIPNDINKDSTVPGNSTNEDPAIVKAIKDVIKVRLPPNVGSGDAGSKPPVEKGQYYSNELVKFIPSTATLWPLNGVVIPQVQNVSTALQPFTSILTTEIQSLLPGMNMTMGSLLSSMPEALLKELMKNLPPEMAGALNVISNLMQSIEIKESGGFSTATKINPDVFFVNAVNLLVESKTVYDLIGTLQRLQYDTTLYGLDSLPSISITLTGSPFGDIPVSVDAFGNITNQLPEPVKLLISTFSSLMSNGSQFPGVFPGANMFGKSSTTLNDMFNRLPSSELSKAVSQMQKNVASGLPSRDKLNKMCQLTMTGTVLGLAALKKIL